MESVLSTVFVAFHKKVFPLPTKHCITIKNVRLQKFECEFRKSFLSGACPFQTSMNETNHTKKVYCQPVTKFLSHEIHECWL